MLWETHTNQELRDWVINLTRAVNKWVVILNFQRLNTGLQICMAIVKPIRC
jgi:hypothetical protein